MRVAVIGGSGNFGARICKALADLRISRALAALAAVGREADHLVQRCAEAHCTPKALRAGRPRSP